MLVDVGAHIIQDPINRALWGDKRPLRLEQGIYLIQGFNFNHDIRDILIEEWPHIVNGPASYGVVDYPDQLLEKYPVLRVCPQHLCVSFTELLREDMPEAGGWRWRKWGPYLGDKTPTCEYLYDEPEISEVYVYHIYEVSV